MAHAKSAIKRIRQTAKRNARNRSLRATLRTQIKSFNELIEGSQADKARETYPTLQRALDKSVTKGILHKATAARYKSRLALAVKRIENA